MEPLDNSIYAGAEYKPGPPTKLVRSALCYSVFYDKNGKRFKRSYWDISGVWKENAKLTDIFCPDCGHVLMWKSKRVPIKKQR